MMGLAAALLVLSSEVGRAAERIAGPVAADVVRVVDGDTLAIRARVWLGLELTVSVRIRGIDAPELRGRCERETALAMMARDRLTALAGASLTLTEVADDKYAGRVVADVNAGGVDLAHAMIEAGLARPYDGGARAPWCDLAQVHE